MLRKQVGLDATITDAGEFTAIAATWSVDRQNEQIVKGAFEDTITAWKHQGRPIPVHWDHKGDAASVIGSVDPQSMAETDEGLRVEGQLDLQDSEVAREAWRSMKAGRIALSFGYLVTADFKREDGVRELLGIDLFEVSLTPSPANPDTRIVSMKSSTTAVLREIDKRASDNLFSHPAFAPLGTKRKHVTPEVERDIREVAAKAEAEEAKAARKARPVQIKRFEV
jgi:HK97 family phage prohead protease